MKSTLLLCDFDNSLVKHLITLWVATGQSHVVYFTPHTNRKLEL